MSRSHRRSLTLVVCALACVTAGCLQGDYDRSRVQQPLVPEDVAALRGGVDDLTTVLRSLGAPLNVIEVGDEVALAYGWLDETNWNLLAQVPVPDTGSFQVSYGQGRQRLPGVVVFLDEALVVQRVERGVLQDLLPKQRLPRLLDERE